MGHPAFVWSRLAAVSAKHDQLISQILGARPPMCLDLVALQRCSPAELHFAGGASGSDCKVRGPSRCVSPPSSWPTRVSTAIMFWFGSAQCCFDHECCMLVKLGGHSSDGPEEFPPLHAAVGVAVSSTSLPTTVQLVLRQGCWVVGGMLWSQQPRGSAARQGPGWCTNIMVRDMDLLPQERQDGRRLEVVADGLPLFHGHSWQLTPRWCLLWVVMAFHIFGASERTEQLWQPRERKERTHPELTGQFGRAGLVVLAGGRAGDGLRRRRPS